MPESPPPETLAWLHHAASCGQRDAQLTLHILERLEALEKKYETQRLATLEWGKDVDKLMRWSDKHLQRIMALEHRPIPGTVELAAPAPQPAPVATDQELFAVAELERFPIHAYRACYDLGRQYGAGATQPAPEPSMQRLMEAPMDARGYVDLREPPAAQPAPPAAPAGGLVERLGEIWSYGQPLHPSACCAVLGEVAKWLRERGYRAAPADLLEQEAGQ